MKARNLLYHFLCWAAIYLLWVAIFRSYSVRISKTMTIEFCYLIFITADYYIINDLIIPRVLAKKKYALFVILTVLVILLSAWLRSLVALQMNEHFFHGPAILSLRDLFFNSLLNITIWILLITTARFLIDRERTERRLEFLEKERVRNELEYLKAQINPHALFNSINTIYGHIDRNNQTARNILLHFSEILRYQLYECGAEKVNLESEIEYIKNYVAFQQLRKDETLKVHCDIDTDQSGLTIAPLLLVVLIENAFKYVSNFTDRENKICIKIKTNGSHIFSSFINTREPLQTNNRNTAGIGISNLTRRLELLYSGRFQLTNECTMEKYETHLNIKLK